MSAYFYLAMKGIKSSEGQSIIAKAAYRTGTKMEDQFEGKTYDYSRKKWVVYSEQILPEGLEKQHPEYKDPALFWNAAAIEAKPNAQPAKEIVIALPDSMTHAQMTETAKQFVRETFPDRAVLICIHHPPNQDDLGRALTADKIPTTDVAQMDFSGKSHMHLLVSTDTYSADGTKQRRCEKIYLCRQGNGKEKGFTAAEFKAASAEGWEKQYKYRSEKNSKGIWLTRTEAELRGLQLRDRINKYPKSRMYGKRAADLGSKESLASIKQNWENICNQKLREYGIPESISSQNPDDGRMATMHLGHDAYHQQLRAERLEREGKGKQPLPYKVQYNQMVRDYNESLTEQRQSGKILDDKLSAAASKVSRIQNKKTVVNARQAFAANDIATLQRITDQRRSDEERTADTIKLAANLNHKALAILEALMKQLSSLPFYEFGRRKELQRQIAEIKQQVADRDSYIEKLKRTESSSFSSLSEKQKRAEELEEENGRLNQEFEQIMSSIPEELRSRVLQTDAAADIQKEKNEEKGRNKRKKTERG